MTIVWDSDPEFIKLCATQRELCTKPEFEFCWMKLCDSDILCAVFLWSCYQRVKVTNEFCWHLTGFPYVLWHYDPITVSPNAV